MAFDNLTAKLQNVFKGLRSKGRLTEADVKAALREVKMALLEADVSFKVVKQFVKAVQERATGEDVLNSLTPGQTVIKYVNEELVKICCNDNNKNRNHTSYKCLTRQHPLHPSDSISAIIAECIIFP